jgi:NitT/TauT family transport system permease protein
MTGPIGRRRAVAVLQIAIAAALLLLWEWCSRAGWVDPFFVSRPSAIGARVADWFASGRIFPHLAATALEAALAFLFGSAAGVAAGFLLARSEFLGRLFEPYVRVANALPRVVLAPLFLLWFGLGIWSKVALGVTVVFFIVFFNTWQGVRDVDPALIRNARMLGASERQLARHVLLPSALVWIFSSLHISVGFAIIAVVVAEYVGATRGLGFLIQQAEGVFDAAGMFAGMAVLALAVLAVGAGVARLERYLLRWKPGRGEEPGSPA